MPEDENANSGGSFMDDVLNAGEVDVHENTDVDGLGVQLCGGDLAAFLHFLVSTLSLCRARLPATSFLAAIRWVWPLYFTSM